MKIENIALGDSVQIKKSLCHSEFKAKQVCEVIDIDHTDKHGFDVLMQGKNCLDWVNHKHLKKPEPQLKQLDQSVFNGLDEKWRFAAVCGSGKAIAAKDRPETLTFGYFVEDGYLLIGTGYDTTNWQNSLIERDLAKELLEVDLSSELTGSELCRAMLARGDRWILCGNTTDGFASPCVIDGYRCNEDDLGFVLTNGKSIEPQYIHPVNNQGEPLIAADVGL